MADYHGAELRSSSYLSHMNISDLRAVSEALSQINHAELPDSETHEKHPLICMREVLSTGRSALVETSLKQLLCYVNSTSDKIDARIIDIADEKSLVAFDSDDAGNQRPPSFYKAEMRKHSPSLSNPHTNTSTSLLGRDLRRLDFDSHPNEEPSIRVRRHAVIFSIDPIRAIIMSSRIIIIVPPGGMDQILEIVEKYMRGWTKEQVHFSHSNETGHISFESHAYEAILATINTLNSQEYTVVNAEAQDVLSYFNTKLVSILPYTVQEKMRRLKNAVFRLQSKITSLQRALTVLIEDDFTMALMNLSKLRANPDLYRGPLCDEFLSSHEEIEELLESHLLDCNSLGEKIMYLVVTIENAEDLMTLKLDTSRNKLLVVNTRLVVYVVAIGFSAYLTGIYGMNLDNTVTIQFVVYGAFEAMFVGSFSLIIIISASILYYLKRTHVLPSLIESKKYES